MNNHTHILSLSIYFMQNIQLPDIPVEDLFVADDKQSTPAMDTVMRGNSQIVRQTHEECLRFLSVTWAHPTLTHCVFSEKLLTARTLNPSS
ncbi:hypothetical protein PR048_028575 [Dryococelus australis]|uniref:Uncharacterized protein n=1 Tax=Dryococelus australis TaxID=614101 RepID=A0ABQ9GBE0_9NEOP|nr:hypothetical protein PR048_028575 [Dryococelus australis]